MIIDLDLLSITEFFNPATWPVF